MSFLSKNCTCEGVLAEEVADLLQELHPDDNVFLTDSIDFLRFRRTCDDLLAKQVAELLLQELLG
jgi:hypothetical protein